MTLKHSKEISRGKWKALIWTLIVIGVIIFSIFSSTFFMPQEYLKACGYAAVGGILIGLGFGFAYARVFKIKGIDN